MKAKLRASRSDSAKKYFITLSSLTLLLISTFLISLSAGTVNISYADVLNVLLGVTGRAVPEHSSEAIAIVYEIRIPRSIVAILVGAALALSGAAMQAIFRNPLADPGIIGVSSGGALGAVLAIITGAATLNAWTLPTMSFATALITVFAVQAIAATRNSSPATLVLIGIAISSFIGAVISALLANAPEDSDLRGMVFWLNGDLNSRTWTQVQIAIVPIVLGAGILTFFARDLNLLLLGDTQAQTHGVNVQRTRSALLSTTALITAAAVSISGVIGFVGLVVPHLVRLTIGPDNRLLIPASALLGGTFLLSADIVARKVLSPVTLQTGTVVALIGGPVFLALIIRVTSTRRFLQ